MAVEYLGATDYQIGSSGNDVREIQSLLTSRGYSPGPMDGLFGSQTKTAVSRFQSDRGFPIDGIVGPITWAALHGTLPTSPVPAAMPAPKTMPAPTSLVLPVGVSGSLFLLQNPLMLIVGGLGVLALVSMKPRRGRRRRR